MLTFSPITISDREEIVEKVLESSYQNCDFNFLNMMSWGYLYGTAVARYNQFLIFRFRSGDRMAYLPPLGDGSCGCIQNVLQILCEDAHQNGQPLTLMGITEACVESLQTAMPDFFEVTADRDYSDYLYLRESLATLKGKHLQPKRNHCNKFAKLYPDYKFLPLTTDLVPLCRSLYHQWELNKETHTEGANTSADFTSSNFVLDHWDEMKATGGVLLVCDRVVAFTFGARVRRDTFDVCVEKADSNFEGAFSVINRDFVRSLPDEIVYVNREEDMGLEGLRRAKLSYHPEQLLTKYTLTERNF